MKFSEAIRLGGISSRGPTRHKLFENGNTCAIGGALLAAGRLRFIDVAGAPWGYEAPECLIGADPFAEERARPAECPACAPGGVVHHGPKWGTLEGIVFHLWDYHRWSRERIAGFVEGIECEREREATSEHEWEALAVR